jgi:hypothetical protein
MITKTKTLTVEEMMKEAQRNPIAGVVLLLSWPFLLIHQRQDQMIQQGERRN